MTPQSGGPDHPQPLAAQPAPPDPAPGPWYQTEEQRQQAAWTGALGRKWDPQGRGPNGWMMRHVVLVPGGWWRFCGVIVHSCAVILAIVGLFTPPDATADSGTAAYWFTMAGVFTVLGLAFLAAYLVVRRRARQTRR